MKFLSTWLGKAMRKILKVAQREYAETVKTKMFLISVFLTPVFVVGIILLSGYLMRESVRGSLPARNIGITDTSNELSPELQQAFARYNAENPQRPLILKQVTMDEHDPDADMERIKDEVRQGKYDAYLVISKDVLKGSGKSYYYARTKKVTDLELFSTVHRLVNDAVTNKRFRLHDLSPQLIAELRRSVPVEQVDVSSKTGKKRGELAVVMTPFFFLFLMFMGVFGINQHMLTSLIEEKNSRVIEILLSAVTPFQLMVGKIVGLVAIGLTLVGIWGTAAYVAAASRGLSELVSGGLVICFFIYFILGFLLLSSILAAIGSACNTLREAQSLMGPITMLLILPMVMWFYFVQHPEAPLSIILSFFPPIAPMVMILRMAANPDLPLLQILLSIILLAISVPVAMWASAKIFRTGILMYGKPPKPAELLRWLRYK
jgi:ABC-2 type transport system permease protein